VEIVSSIETNFFIEKTEGYGEVETDWQDVW